MRATAVRSRRVPARWAGLLPLAAVALTAGLLFGHHLGTRHRAEARTMARGELPPVDALVVPASFSEVENTRARLNALASQALTEARLAVRPGTSGASPAGRAADDDRRIALLETRRAEFRGTGYEFLFLQDLLLALRARGDHDRWVSLYLDLVYRHPTHGLVATLADVAPGIARRAGRLGEIEQAFRHVLDIPIEFSSRDRLEAAVAPAVPPAA